MAAYYNEHDPFAAAWLRELIKGGHIADGEVDDRSIVDVRPDELTRFTQCHFFAGIGTFSYSLRRAGWTDDRPIWTGSCPCQPFSAAGQGAGFDDERHLWPHFHWLIAQCRPPVITGEQVASKDADAWIDLVQSDMEALGYAFGAVAFPSASVGAPHIRDRTYWMAYDAMRGREHEPSAKPSGVFEQAAGDTRVGAELSGHSASAGGMDHHHHQGLEGQRSGYQAEVGRNGEVRPAAEAGEFGGLADVNGRQQHGKPVIQGAERDGQDTGRAQGSSEFEPCRNIGGMAHSHDGIAKQLEGQRPRPGEAPGRWPHGQSDRRSELAEGQSTSGPTNGHWRDADWLFCRDGKWRPVEPGSFPLVNGASARVGRLRGYGNAINAVQAQVFIEEIQDMIYPAVEL